jgi:hypothetical protein
MVQTRSISVPLHYCLNSHSLFIMDETRLRSMAPSKKAKQRRVALPPTLPLTKSLTKCLTLELQTQSTALYAAISRRSISNRTFIKCVPSLQSTDSPLAIQVLMENRSRSLPHLPTRHNSFRYIHSALPQPLATPIYPAVDPHGYISTPLRAITGPQRSSHVLLTMGQHT